MQRLAASLRKHDYPVRKSNSYVLYNANKKDNDRREDATVT